MPWRPEPMKVVGELRKASGSRLPGFDPEMTEIGKPNGVTSIGGNAVGNAEN